MKLYLKPRPGEVLSYECTNIKHGGFYRKTIRLSPVGGGQSKAINYEPSTLLSLRRGVCGVYVYSEDRRGLEFSLQLTGEYVKPEHIHIKAHRIDVEVNVELTLDNGYLSALERNMRSRLLREVQRQVDADGHDLNVSGERLNIVFRQRELAPAGSAGYTVESSERFIAVLPSIRDNFPWTQPR